MTEGAVYTFWNRNARSSIMASHTSGLMAMSPVSAEVRTISVTSVSMRAEWLAPSTRCVVSGRSASRRIPARMASSMSWFTYAMRSAVPTMRPSQVSACKSPVWFRMPSRTSAVRFKPAPPFSMRSTTRTDCSLWR